MLPGLVTQGTFRLQAQAQHLSTQPIQATYVSWQSVASWVENCHLQVIHHLALASQAPALLALVRTQRVR
ncbi:hypothetical protein D3C76_1806970 [compost metagenome]